MNENKLHKLVYSKNVVEFVTVANEYCGIIEKVNNFPIEDNLHRLQKLLPLLYLKATLLPNVEKVLEEDVEKFLTELDYNLWQQKWQGALGEYDSFYEVFDPDIQFGEEMVTASISENLMDIYQDLKDFLLAYRLGDEAIMNDALSDCTFHFEDFWGQRLVNVLRAIHKLIVENVNIAQESQKDDDNIKPGKGSPEWFDKFWGTRSDEK